MVAPVLGKSFVVMRHWLNNSKDKVFQFHCGGSTFDVEPSDGYVLKSSPDLVWFPKPSKLGCKSTALSLAKPLLEGECIIFANLRGQITSSASTFVGSEHCAHTVNGWCGSLVIQTDLIHPKIVGFHAKGASSGSVRQTNGFYPVTDDILGFLENPVFPNGPVLVKD